jgi:hypothetical protein
VASLDWAKYNFVHMMMHGEGDGRLCFEKVDNYKDIDHMEIPDFLSVFTNGNIQDLSCMFLSFCFSAGGGTMEKNLSFELVRLGVSQHVIAYNGSVGTVTAQNFSQRFYSHLLGGSSIKESFKKSLLQLKGTDNSVYVPVLYTRYINTSRVSVA